jgi:hypothetical protein
MYKRASGSRGGGVERFKSQHSLSAPSKRPLTDKQKKWAKVEKEAREIKKALAIVTAAEKRAEQKKVLSQKPRLIKKGQTGWKPARR